MRVARVLGEGEAFYHILSRIVDRRLILDELSRKCSYSPDHLRKLFLTEYGMTPLDYRNRHRMAGAVALLSNSNLSVKEVATAIGFRHVSHFCTMFRETCNMTPREAIRKYRTHNAGTSG